jgi:hypothetical protein
VPGWEDFTPENIPGTAAYMAPEMFKGEAGDEATDIYALGVTMFRAFTGEYPYGNPDATSPPRRDRPKDLAALRPDLPAWLGAVLGRAIAAEPSQRYRDAMEFAAEMEAGPGARAPATDAARTRSRPVLAGGGRIAGAGAALVALAAIVWVGIRKMLLQTAEFRKLRTTADEMVAACCHGQSTQG